MDEFRFSAQSDDWRSLEQLQKLEPHEQQMFTMTLKLDESLTRRRRMSPAEVFDEHRRNLIKLPIEAVPDLLARDLAKERTVQRGMIIFEDADLGPGKHRFLAQLRDPSGFTRPLTNGDAYTTLVNPFDPERMFISDKDGRYLGTLERWHSVDASDAEAVKKQIGRAEREFKNATAELGMRHGNKRLAQLGNNTKAIRKTITEATQAEKARALQVEEATQTCLLYTSPSPRDA